MLQKGLQTLIEQKGPIPLDQFLDICISYYYNSKDPFGRSGDFITAPEISQMFGEIIGVWCIITWINLGKPQFNLIEIGGGRGTLMADLLRSTKYTDGFSSSIKTIYMIEPSISLRRLQEQQLEAYGYNVVWCDNFEEIEHTTSIIINNEFFDALSIKQFLRTEKGFRELLVTYSNNHFALISAELEINLDFTCKVGDIIELSPARDFYMNQIAKFIKKYRGAGLIIDYGYLYKPHISTLQAVKNHQHHNIFEDIGEADLTSHVDFGAMIEICHREKLKYSFCTQREFLIMYGIMVRASKLIEKGADKSQLDLALTRLTATEQMGELFKVLSFFQG